jgi:uncharacterized membrane protein
MDLLMILQDVSWVGQRGMGARPQMFNPFSIMIIQMLIIAITLFIIWWMLRSHYKKMAYSSNDRPIDILNKRYAAGEITKEDYEQLRKEIS